MNQKISSILIRLLEEINNLNQNKKIWVIEEEPQSYFSIIEELFDEKLSEIDDEIVRDFYTFLLEGTLFSLEDYKNLRDYLIIPVFGINTSKCSDSYEVRDKILNRITHQIFSLNLSDEIRSLTNFLICALLGAEVATKYFYGPSNNYYTDQYKENLRFIDNIEIDRSEEINFDDYKFSSDVFEEVGNNPNSDYINYQNILYTDKKSAELLTYDAFFGSGITNLDSNVSNLEIIKNKNTETDYILTFDFDDYEGQYGMKSDFFFKIDIIHYVDTEIWETYLADSFRNYQNHNYKLAFLLAFIAIESYIENIIYKIKSECLPETISALYYERYGRNCWTISEVQYFRSEAPDDEFEIYVNQLKCERDGLDDILWYVNLYRTFLNNHRNLTEDKLKDIIKVMSQLSQIKSNPENSSIIDFGLLFGNQTCLESVILDNLTKYSKIRNKLAHGSELEEAERDFRYFYSNLIIIFTSLVEYVNGKKLIS